MRIAITLFLIGLPLTAAQQVRWEQTPEEFSGKYVKVRLTSGVRVEGYWSNVTADTFTMRVEKSTDSSAIPKGIQQIPRASIENIWAGKRHTRGRVIGTIAGAYGVGGIAAAATKASPAAIFGVWGGAVLGYFLGRSYDHATIEYVVEP